MSTRRLSSTVLLAASFLGCAAFIGCTSKGTTSSTHGTGGGKSTSSASGSGTSTGAGGMPPGTMPLSASIGPIHVMPGEESVQCITTSLKNADSVIVRRFKTQLLTGSHHMIVYATSAAENLTPTPCQSFAGVLGGDHPIFIAQQAHSELDFPNDATGKPVGLELPPNQMLRLEMHFINATPNALDVTGTAEMDVLPSTADVVKSDLAFWGTQKFPTIPANGEADSGVKFHAALPDTHIFALTTHQHHLGTEMQVWYGAQGDMSRRVADGKTWADPPLELYNPTLDFPAGQNLGLSYECHWVNTTSSPVSFGEGFNNEMCFLWHYYYPSQGFQYCVDNFCATKP